MNNQRDLATATVPGSAGGRARITAMLALGLAFAACEPTPAPDVVDSTAAISDVRELEERLRLAIVRADTATLGALLAPEYLSTSAVGHTSTRLESLAAYGSGLVSVDTATVRELDVRVYGSTAVALGFMDWSGAAATRPFFGTVRFQHVWVRQDGAWRLVASQLTNQPPRELSRPEKR